MRHAIQRHRYRRQTQREQQYKLKLSFRRQHRPYDDRDRETDEQQVGEHIRDGHGQKLGITLATAAAWVGEDLPVVGEGAAFGQVGDDDGNEGGG